MKPLNAERHKNFWTVIVLLIPLVLVLYYKDKVDPITFNGAYTYGFFFYLLVAVWYFLEEQGKYASPQAVFNGGHICISRPPMIWGMWAIFTDGIKAPYLPLMDLKSAVVVVPKDYVYKIGEYYVSSVKVSKIMNTETNYVVRSMIDSFGFNENNVWFGIHGNQFSIQDERVLLQLKEELEHHSDRTTRNVNYAKGNLKDWQDTAGDITGVLKDVSPNKKSIIESIKDSLKSKDEKEK